MHFTKYILTNVQKLIFLSLCSSLVLSAQKLDLTDSKSAQKAFKSAFQNGDGQLLHEKSVFEYTTENPTDKDFDYRLVLPARLKASKDFEVIGVFKNDSIAESSNEVASIGIEIYQRNNLSNRLAAELSVARFQGYFSRTVFSQIVESGEKKFDCFSNDLRLPETTKIKLYYNSERKVFSVYYEDLNANTSDWISIGSFGIAGNGGENGNAQWKMRSSENFLLYLYGFSKNMKIYQGDIQVHSLEINHNFDK